MMATKVHVSPCNGSTVFWISESNCAKSSCPLTSMVHACTSTRKPNTKQHAATNPSCHVAAGNCMLASPLLFCPCLFTRPEYKQIHNSRYVSFLAGLRQPPGAAPKATLQGQRHFPTLLANLRRHRLIFQLRSRWPARPCRHFRIATSLVGLSLIDLETNGNRRRLSQQAVHSGTGPMVKKSVQDRIPILDLAQAWHMQGTALLVPI